MRRDLEAISREGAAACSRGAPIGANPHLSSIDAWRNVDDMFAWAARCAAWSAGWRQYDDAREAAMHAFLMSDGFTDLTSAATSTVGRATGPDELRHLDDSGASTDSGRLD